MLKTSLSQSVLVRQTSARIGQCRTDRKGSLSLSKISSSNSNYCNRNTTLKDQIRSSKASAGRRKHSVAAMNFFGGLFGGEKKRQVGSAMCGWNGPRCSAKRYCDFPRFYGDLKRKYCGGY